MVSTTKEEGQKMRLYVSARLDQVEENSEQKKREYSPIGEPICKIWSVDDKTGIDHYLGKLTK